MLERRGPVRCSFCGKKEPQVRRILAGPGVYICNECVYLCEEMLKEEQIFNDAAPANEISDQRAELQHLHGLLRLESRLVKDLRIENEQLRAKQKPGRRTRPVKS